MKPLICLLLSAFMLASPEWHNSLDEAKQIAKKEHKYILLSFSGSDWCGPCIRMHKEIFGSDAFSSLASSNLVLVNADFPRLKKNQLSKKQQDINNAMADQYNSQGAFPYTVLLDAEGKILKSWDGLPTSKPEEFCSEVKEAIGVH